MWFYTVLAVILLAVQQCSGNVRNCLEKEKSLGVLDFARQSIEKAESLFPDCFDYENSTNSSVCGKKEKALAFLQIAKDLIATAEKNYPTCLDVITTVFPDENTTVLPDFNTTLLPDENTTVLPDFNTTLLPDVSSTVLPDLTTTVLPEILPMDCSDVLEFGHKTSGVYKVRPRSSLTKNSSISVYCDMETNGGGWTVIQRRGGFPLLQNFNQSWAHYKKGFGDINEEFWLGNDNIYLISNQAKYEVRFDLSDFEGNRRYAIYENFRIESEAEKYKLIVSGDYNGNAGDSLYWENGSWFSTFDRNNEKQTNIPPCPISRGTGWWYDNCNKVHINGIPDRTTSRFEPINLYWKEWKGYESLATAEMKLRRRI